MIIARQSAEMEIASYLTDPSTGGNRLMKIILERENVSRALKQVRANKGAPGVDGMTVDQLPSYLRRHWKKIKIALLNGTYEPLPVRRKEEGNSETTGRCKNAWYSCCSRSTDSAGDFPGASTDMGAMLFEVQFRIPAQAISAPCHFSSQAVCAR